MSPQSVSSHSCDPSRFKDVCSRFPTGVAVTTAIDETGAPRGVTVSSFTSASLEPPIILVCLDRRSQMLKHLSISRHIGVNILSETQASLAIQFARNWAERFDSVEWECGRTGVPVLKGVAAHIECIVTDVAPVGDHVVLFARVLLADCYERRPLAYANRGFGGFIALSSTVE